MSTDEFRDEIRSLLARMLEEAPQAADRDLMLQMYVDEINRIYGRYAHQLLDEVIADAHTRLDARLSPDPIRQTIASVQTTVQDIWRTLWGPNDTNRNDTNRGE
jgi:hypothetical protein